MTVDEYQKALFLRSEAVSVSRSRRMRGLPTEELPPKPKKTDIDKIPIAYRKDDGGYEGALTEEDECPEGCVVKWERPHPYK